MSDDDLRTLFDIAVHSLDFGSGFLDDEEVEALRRVAVQLGVNPMEATPVGFTTKYPHAFEASMIERPWDGGPPRLSDRCHYCTAEEDAPHHTA